MSSLELTKDNFDEIVSHNDFILIDFWADWCPPCRMFGPVYEAASKRHSDLVFGKVDTVAQPELAQAFGVQSIPTLAIIRDKVAIFSQPGALPESALEDLIEQSRKVDMDEVRKQIADEQKKHGQQSEA
ncbi:thioredoxin family protein [Streptomyces sp. NPDC102437]|uniref:thioredoxin family protein n=1 Tax=Streptomyces sp. NPDC102437 TaxID=3366175 RepID=UPI003817B875